MMSLIIENDRSPCKQVSNQAMATDGTKKVWGLFLSFPHLSAGVPNSLLVQMNANSENSCTQFDTRSETNENSELTGPRRHER